MPFDILCVALLVIFAIWGAFRGFVRQFFGLLGFIGGILLARLVAPAFGDAFGGDMHISPAVATAALAFVLFILAEAIAKITGRVVHQQLGGGVTGGLNRVGGALLGSAKGFLVVWALASLIALVRPHFKRVERDTPVAKLELKESYAVQLSEKTNLISRLREGGLQDEAETVRKRLGNR
ncbi:MAG TPA: CvpA family protein [Myxococcales bacterium]|nr:CvpA family protein [Myxococcales bacterium]